MIEATVVFIDKSRPDFPLHMAQFPMDERVLWNYYHNDDESLLNAAKFLMGIPAGTPTFRAVFVDHLVDPSTGEVLTGIDFSLSEFMAQVFTRQQELIHEARQHRPRVCRSFYIPTVRV